MNTRRPTRALHIGGALMLSACAVHRAPPPEEPVVSAGEAAVETSGPVVVLFPELPRSSAIDALRLRAEAQRVTPGPVGAAPGWLTESQRIAPDAMEEASAPLEAVLGPIRAEPRFVEAPSPPPPVSAEDADQALRLYARGRLARGGGEHAEALTAFESASRLDPSSAEIWRALGDAQLAAGLRSSGLRSFQMAAERGLDDVRAWALIGLEAVRRRDTANGVRWLVAARDGLAGGADPIAISWIEVSLGELLLTQDRVRAGAELLRSALTRPVTESSRSAFQSEYATLVRRRPHLWLRAGDAWALIGDWAEAADAYERAALESTEELTETISRRRTAVLIASGRSAEASLALLDGIRRAQGRLGAEDLRTLEQLGRLEPALADAVADLTRGLDPAWPSTRSRLLLARLVAAPDGVSPDAIHAGSALSAEHVVAVVSPVEGDEERWRVAQRLTEHRPADAEAVAEALFAGGLVRGPALAELASSADLLSLRVRLRMGMPDRSIDLSGAADSTELEIARIETATRLGRWDDARRLAEPLADRGGLDGARALSAASFSRRAFDLWRSAFDSSTDTEELLLGARLAIESGRAPEAAAILLRTHGLDPGEERVYEHTLALLRHPDAFEGRDRLEEAMRTVRTHAPDSAALESLEIAEIHQRGFAAEACARAQLLMDRLPAPSVSDFSALMALWHEADERGDTALLESAEKWLVSALDAERPTEARAIALASVVALRSTAGDALALLASLPLARTPTLIQAEAGLLILDDRSEQAFALLRALYDQPTLSVGDTLQLALVELQQDHALDDSLDRLSGVPADMQVRPEDIPTLIGVCNGLMSRLLGNGFDSPGSNAHGLQYAALAAFAIDRDASLPEPYHRVRLRCLAQVASTPLTEIERATAQMHAALGRLNDATFEDVFGLLIERGRTQDAILWGVSTVMLDSELDAQRWTAVAVPLAALGTIETVEVVLDRLEEAGRLESAVEALVVTDGAPSPTNFRAELGYRLATVAGARDRTVQAMELYRLAVRYQPDHAWACNDFGYMLAEREEDLEEAERLIELAYAALPDETSVLDSMGWLRYKQGRFVEPDGDGALALIERAAASMVGAANPTVLDHLGDVRWMTGDGDGAVDAWERAEQFYLESVRELNSPDLRRLPVYSKLQARLGSIRDKLRLAEIEGGEPPVAQTRGERQTGGE